ncbi:uncharacterized protein LOC126817931 [Patella vulgata]|uniref:uncharacterized protein LOC126817931 n=1 Tax=Patella vulgata TaxID=6465 RepID=UPI0024A9E74C|nr:uncharacterized protein LOC126817931 [Patella vulgata]
MGATDEKIAAKIDYVGYVAIPVFLLLGLSGNTLTIIVMLSKHFRKMSGLNIFESTEPTMVIYREVAQILEQLNYSINFFMYVLCSKSFRDRVKLVLTCQEEPSSRYRSQYSTKASTIRAKKEVCTEKSSSGISSVDGNLSGVNCAEINNSKPTRDDCDP